MNEEETPNAGIYMSMTRVLHADRLAGVEHGAIHSPIHTSVQYTFERTSDLIDLFQGRLKGRFNYARSGTPTIAALERKITHLEGGRETVCFASGMAAISAVFVSLLRAGDHIVVSRFLFGGTVNLLDTLQGFGVQVSFVDTCDVRNVRAEVRENTRLVFVETVANPATQIPDLEPIGQLCRERELLLIVDNTVTSPALFRPATVGAGLVVNSLSKTIGGHGVALGGAVTDTGRFDWTLYPNIAARYRNGDPAQWGIQQLRKKGLRDVGGALSSDHAHRIAVGVETLALRARQTGATALALARFLSGHAAIGAVHYPGLETHPQHALAKRLFANGAWLLSFELKQADDMISFLDCLRVAGRGTGMGDNRTLVIPVAPTIYWEIDRETREQMKISDGLIRVSIGLEEPGDLIRDFDEALRLGS